MRFLLLFIVCFTCLTLRSQTFPYDVRIDSLFVPELGGIQSFTVGQANGKWLIIGGRLDGLHRRQPFAAFDVAGHNNQLIVVDPIDQRKWTASLDTLDDKVSEQLSSGNMNFVQKGDLLFITGGYGYSPVISDHRTFPYFTMIEVSELIDAVIDGEDIRPFIHQIEDQEFAVTGGQLQFIDDVFYLVGGHRFDGRYNPNNLNTFTQTYTESVKRFRVDTTANPPVVTHLTPIVNAELLHRRDLNVLPQIMPDGTQGIMAFSGVFQHDVDLPYLTAVEIYGDTAKQVPHFAQYYNQYHCASISMHEPVQGKMYNLFFGGISQYYDSLGFLVQDNDVPFVRTVSCVSRDINGWMEEFKIPISMPGYLGAASEFILNPNLRVYENDVVKLDSLLGDSTLLGFIYGGVHSSAANVFWINTGLESKASQMIYPIYLIRNHDAVTNINDQSINTFQLQVYPNPVDNEITIAFTNPIQGNVEIRMENMMHEIAYEKTLKNFPAGPVNYKFNYRKLERGDVYYLKVLIDKRMVTQKVIVH